MRIVLVQPQVHKTYRLNLAFEPISVAYLKSACISAGFEDTRIFYNADMPPEKTAQSIAALKPDIVGFSSMTFNYPLAKNIAARLRKHSDAVQVIGGYHATALPEEILSEGVFDYVIVGMGEKPLPELAARIEEGNLSFEDKKTVPGLAWNQGDAFHVNPSFFPETLDELPFAERSDYDFSHFMDKSIEFWNQPKALVAGSRGCPFACHFCSAPMFYKRRRILRSPESLGEEVYEISKKYGIKNIFFADETMFNDKEWFLKCAALWKKRVPDIKWFAIGMLRDMDDDIINSIADNGGLRIAFGVEHVRKLKGVPIKYGSFDHAEHVIRKLRKKGVFTFISYIVGLPGDNGQSMKEEGRLLRSFSADYLGAPIATPYPGTVFRRDLIEQGTKLEQDWAKYDMDTPTFALPDLDGETLKALRSEILRKYHLRLGYFKVVLERLIQDPTRIITYFKLFYSSLKLGHFRKVGAGDSVVSPACDNGGEV